MIPFISGKRVQSNFFHSPTGNQTTTTSSIVNGNGSQNTRKKENSATAFREGRVAYQQQISQIHHRALPSLEVDFGLENGLERQTQGNEEKR